MQDPESIQNQEPQWYVLRDLKRPNSKTPAYKVLPELGFEVFTPMTSKIITNGGKRTKVNVPFVYDLLFVYSSKEALDKIIKQTDTLQYRYVKGAPFGTPMTVRTTDMNRFIAAVTSVKTPTYYAPNEITPNMYGAKIRMVCNGPINGFEGTLLKIKGSGKKRLLVELPGLLAASIEIAGTDYIELLDN